MTIKVEKTLVYDPKVKKAPHLRLAAYRDIRTDKDGWANPKDSLPADFDLVYMKVLGKKTICGWINGKSWDGLKLKKGDRIIYWKRKIEEDEE